MYKNKYVNLKNLGLIDYEKAWKMQEAFFNEIISIKLANRKLSKKAQQPTPNYLFFCEHPHVYTLGRSGSEKNLLIKKKILQAKKVTFYAINRGGDITYHGPGQVVVYLMLDLDNFFTDIHRYIRYLEQAVILTLRNFSINARRIQKLTGVWLDYDNLLDAKKICSIGVRASRWVTMHGMALNVNTDLSYFDHIVPCGIPDKSVTSMQQQLGRAQSMQAVLKVLQQHIFNVFGMCLHGIHQL